MLYPSSKPIKDIKPKRGQAATTSSPNKNVKTQ